MTKQFVRVLADVDCEWEGLAPTYRLYLNDELFAERTWLWTEHYLEEVIVVRARPGHYPIRYELVKPEQGRLKVRNVRIGTESDPAVIHDEQILEILE
jgi:hypothetical protein